LEVIKNSSCFVSLAYRSKFLINQFDTEFLNLGLPLPHLLLRKQLRSLNLNINIWLVILHKLNDFHFFTTFYFGEVAAGSAFGAQILIRILLCLLPHLFFCLLLLPLNFNLVPFVKSHFAKVALADTKSTIFIGFEGMIGGPGNISKIQSGRLWRTIFISFQLNLLPFKIVLWHACHRFAVVCLQERVAGGRLEVSGVVDGKRVLLILSQIVFKPSRIAGDGHEMFSLGL